MISEAIKEEVISEEITEEVITEAEAEVIEAAEDSRMKENIGNHPEPNKMLNEQMETHHVFSSLCW